MAIATEPIVLTVLCGPDERGWVRARVPECPELVTCGRDRDEARTMVGDALRQLLLSRTVSVETAGSGNREQRETLVVTIAAGPSPVGRSADSRQNASPTAP
jgi:predicted RNase H-like HicB family nuclease